MKRTCFIKFILVFFYSKFFHFSDSFRWSPSTIKNKLFIRLPEAIRLLKAIPLSNIWLIKNWWYLSILLCIHMRFSVLIGSDVHRIFVFAMLIDGVFFFLLGNLICWFFRVFGLFFFVWAHELDELLVIFTFLVLMNWDFGLPLIMSSWINFSDIQKQIFS